MGALLPLIIQNLPEWIALIRQQFATQHPDQPLPTDAEVIATFHQALASSLLKDEAWLALHPEE